MVKIPEPARALRVLTVIALVAFLLVLVILAVVYEPKSPEVVAKTTTLQRIDIGLPDIKLNITMVVHVYVKNRSNAGFRYMNTTTEVYYHGVLVGESPIAAGAIRRQAVQNISTPVDVVASKVISHPCFLKEIESGSLYFTATSKVDGNGVFLGFFKSRAQVFVSCDVIVFVLRRTLTSHCNSIVKY